MAELKFTSQSGLGEFLLAEPTRPELKGLIYRLRQQWTAPSPEAGEALAAYVQQIAKPDMAGLSVFEEIVLCDEIATHLFTLSTEGGKKKHVSESGSGSAS